MNRHERRALKGQVNCDTHGKVRWQKHIICAKCKTVYDANVPGLVPIFCVCKERIFPEHPQDNLTTFTGRPICPQCYADKKLGMAVTTTDRTSQ